MKNRATAVFLCILSYVNDAQPLDPGSSAPDFPMHRTPAEQAARVVWLVRVLAQVSMAIGYLLRALAQRQAGEGAAAEADVRRALAWIDRITEELEAQRRADIARAAMLRRGAGAAAAGQATEPAFVAVAMMAGRRAARVQTARFQTAGGDGGRTQSVDAPCMARHGFWRDPLGPDNRRWVLGLAISAVYFVTISY